MHETTMANSTALRRTLEIVIDAAPNGAIVCGEAGRILFANRQVGTIFGYQAEELVGESIDGLLPEASRGRHH